MKVRKEYKLFSKNRNAFYTGPGQHFAGELTYSKKEKVWKSLSAVYSTVEWVWSLIKWPRSNNVDFSNVTDLEVIEYEVVLIEKNRISLRDELIKRKRSREIRKRFGYKIGRMYEKITDERLLDFRYLIALSTFESFDDAKGLLKETGVRHRVDYRCTHRVFALKDINHAIYLRLSFADESSDVYDVQTLMDIDVTGGQHTRG